MMDFSGHAGAGSDFGLLPKGLLVFAILQVRGVKASGSGGSYIDCELTVDQGQPYAGRKLWDMIGNPFHEGNSEKYRNMGMVAITRILEAANNAGPHNPAGYQLGDFSQLTGMRVPIKVGIEDGSNGHDDKNRVAEWLTPNPASQSGNKPFVKLMNGDHGLPQQTTAGGAQGGFGGAAAPVQAKPVQGGFGAAPAAAAVPAATSGFGGTDSGFQQPPAQAAGANGATTAGNQSSPTLAAASPSDPGATPGWLAQAGGQAQG